MTCGWSDEHGYCVLADCRQSTRCDVIIAGRAVSAPDTFQSTETPEQRARFYLEVAALLGNTSAADRLREMDGR